MKEHSAKSLAMSLEIRKAVPGSIFWLPSYEACAGRLVLDLDQDSYNHPVLVLTTNHKQATATVLIVRIDIPERAAMTHKTVEHRT